MKITTITGKNKQTKKCRLCSHEVIPPIIAAETKVTLYSDGLVFPIIAAETEETRTLMMKWSFLAAETKETCTLMK